MEDKTSSQLLSTSFRYFWIQELEMISQESFISWHPSLSWGLYPGNGLDHIAGQPKEEELLLPKVN